MNRDDIKRLLDEAMKITNHRDYVIIGSLSVLGAIAHPPISMTGSIDVDLYPKNDPGRAFEIANKLGLGSDFEQTYRLRPSWHSVKQFFANSPPSLRQFGRLG